MQHPLQSSMSVNIPQNNAMTNILIPIPPPTDAFKTWTKDVNDILDKIRINSIILSNEHKKTYFILAARIKWFRIPVIFLSAIGSIFGIGLGPYMAQTFLSALCSVLSMIVGLIGSLELFLAISNKMENELVQSKELYLLAIEIQKTLLLNIENRNGDGTTYLEDKFNIYSKLIEKSYLLECKIMDELTPLPSNYRSYSNVQTIEKQKKTLRSSLNTYIPFQKSLFEPNLDIHKTEENNSVYEQVRDPRMSGCGISNRVEDNHAYSEERRRSPEEYEQNVEMSMRKMSHDVWSGDNQNVIMQRASERIVESLENMNYIPKTRHFSSIFQTPAEISAFKLSNNIHFNSLPFLNNINTNVSGKTTKHYSQIGTEENQIRSQRILPVIIETGQELLTNSSEESDSPPPSGLRASPPSNQRNIVIQPRISKVDKSPPSGQRDIVLQPRSNVDKSPPSGQRDIVLQPRSNVDKSSPSGQRDIVLQPRSNVDKSSPLEQRIGEAREVLQPRTINQQTNTNGAINPHKENRSERNMAVSKIHLNLMNIEGGLESNRHHDPYQYVIKNIFGEKMSTVIPEKFGQGASVPSSLQQLTSEGALHPEKFGQSDEILHQLTSNVENEHLPQEKFWQGTENKRDYLIITKDSRETELDRSEYEITREQYKITHQPTCSEISSIEDGNYWVSNYGNINSPRRSGSISLTDLDENMSDQTHSVTKLPAELVVENKNTTSQIKKSHKLEQKVDDSDLVYEFTQESSDKIQSDNQHRIPATSLLYFKKLVSEENSNVHRKSKHPKNPTMTEPEPKNDIYYFQQSEMNLNSANLRKFHVPKTHKTSLSEPSIGDANNGNAINQLLYDSDDSNEPQRRPTSSFTLMDNQRSRGGAKMDVLVHDASTTFTASSPNATVLRTSTLGSKTDNISSSIHFPILQMDKVHQQLSPQDKKKRLTRSERDSLT